MKLFAPTEILLAFLYVGLVAAGGLRDPALWTAAAAAVWLVALAWPAPLAALKPWLPWLGWALLCLLACAQPAKGVYTFSRWATLIAFFGVAAAHWRPRDSQRWFWGLALSALALGLGSLFVPGTIHPMTGLLPPYYNYTMFVEAAFLAAAMGALLHPDGPKGPARWALAALMLFAAYLLARARSRGAMGAAGLAAIVWMLRHGKKRQLGLGLLAAGGAALLAPGISAYLLKLDMAVWFKRPQIWLSALKIVRDHPILGEGPGNFEQGFLRHNFPGSWATRYGFYSDHAHSEILEAAAETGLVGLGLFLAAWAFSLKIKGAKTATQEAGLCAFTAMSAHCLVDNMLHMPALGMLFFSSLICAGGGAPAAPVRIPRLWRPLAFLGLLLALGASWPKRLVERYVEKSDAGAGLAPLNKAIALFPADYYLREKAARLYLAQQPPDVKRALEELARAQSLNPTNALYPNMQAELALAGGEPRRAAELAGRAVALEPNYLEARLLLARAWTALGDKNAARQELAELRRRHAALQGVYSYTNYDRTLVSLDEARLKAAAKALSP